METTSGFETLVERLLSYRPRREPVSASAAFRKNLENAIAQLPNQEQVVLRGSFDLDGVRRTQRQLMQQLGLAKTAQVVKLRDQAVGRLYDQLLLPPRHSVGLWVRSDDRFGFIVDYCSPRMMLVRSPAVDSQRPELRSSTGGIDKGEAVELVEPLDWRESERRARQLAHPPLRAEALARLAPLTDAADGDALLQEALFVVKGRWLATERVALLQLVVQFGHGRMLVQAATEALLACVAAEEDERARVAALGVVAERSPVLSEAQRGQLSRLATRLLYEAPYGNDDLARIAGLGGNDGNHGNDDNDGFARAIKNDQVLYHQRLQGQLHQHLSAIAQRLRGRAEPIGEDKLRDPMADAALLFEEEKRRPLSMLRGLFEPRVPWRDYAAVQRLLALAFCQLAEQGASSARDLALQSLPIGEVGTAAFRIAANGVVYWGYGGGWSYEGGEPLEQWAHDSVAALFYLANAFYDMYGRDASLEQALAWATGSGSTDHWPRFESSRQRAAVIEPWLRQRFDRWLKPGSE